MKYRHLFGPVASRRLGISLGVDLVVHKVCSLDCVYCECGQTTDLTSERKEWVSFDRVKDELDHYWANNDDPDYITFSGSGEPCLNINLGRVISYIKEKKPGIQVAVLTNATLLSDPGVREELALADLVVPSLDAATENAFRKINRPCKAIDLNSLVQGIQDFTRQFNGRVHLEIFILEGVNDTDEELGLFKQAISKIGPDLVQLNSLDRPGTCDFVRPATLENLERIKTFLGPEHVEIIATVPSSNKWGTGRSANKSLEQLETAVLETVHRRPSTCEDLSSMLGAEKTRVQSVLDRLVATGQVEYSEQERGIFYQTCKSGSET